MSERAHLRADRGCASSGREAPSKFPRLTCLTVCALRRSPALLVTVIAALTLTAPTSDAALDLQSSPLAQDLSAGQAAPPPVGGGLPTFLTQPDPTAADSGVPNGTTELAGLRARRSRTFERPNGSKVTRLYQGPVNYRDSYGQWQPIDNTLVPSSTSGFAYRNRANSYVAELPQNLQAPVRFAVGDDAVRLALEDANAAVTSGATTATYADALPGVTAKYFATNEALKEALILRDPTSQRSFRFRLSLTPGLTARIGNSGNVEFVRNGETVFSLAPPVMQDSSGSLTGVSTKVDLRLDSTSDGYELMMTPDSAWLSDPARAWPVLIDPSIYFSSGGECTISSVSATQCRNPAFPWVVIGKNGASGEISRSLFRFDLAGQVPRDATVNSATLGLYMAYLPQQYYYADLHQLTKDWNSQVSWTTTNGATAWSSPGGDFASAPAATPTFVSPQINWYRWDLTSLAQNWVNGATPNQGVLLKSSGQDPQNPGGETGQDYTYFYSSSFLWSQYWPYLQVDWAVRATARYTSVASSSWVPDGGTKDTPQINAVKSLGDTLYVGGNFDYFGPPTGSFASISSSTGSYSPGVAQASGSASDPPDPTSGVRAVVSDGSGGWYIGGDFKYVGGHPRARLAHIKSDGSLDVAWDPQLDGTVYALALSPDNNYLYVGGSFTTVDGVSRAGVAKFNATANSNGALVANWNPNCLGTVRAIAIGPTGPGSKLYVGGAFSGCGGASQPNLAALDQSSGFVLAWGLGGADAGIRALALNGTTMMYVGGNFAHVAGAARAKIAQVNTSDGTATAWTSSPAANSRVNSIAPSGSTVYVGGEFTTIGGQSRRGLARLDASSASTLNWNPSPPAGDHINAITLNNGSLYVGGTFNGVIGGSSRRFVAALDPNADAGTARAWDPSAGNEVYALGVSSGSSPQIGVGGRFRSVNGEIRRNLAALDTSGGANGGRPMNWNPDLNGAVSALELSDGKLYVGGSFTAVDSASGSAQTRNGLASYICANNKLTPWNPTATGLRALKASAGRLYVAASSVKSLDGNTTRTNAGAYKLDGPGDLDGTWSPSPNGAVNAIESDGQFVYLGGTFQDAGGPDSGSPQSYFAVVDPATGIKASGGGILGTSGWGLDGEVDALAVWDHTLYMGGRFTSFVNGAYSRNHLAAVTNTQGQLQFSQTWQPSANGPVEVLAADSRDVFAGGRFSSVQSISRPGLAEIDPGDGSVLPFTPQLQIRSSSDSSVTGTPRALDISGDRLAVAGDYFAVEPSAQQGLALYTNYGRLLEPADGIRTGKRLTLQAQTQAQTFGYVKFEYQSKPSGNQSYSAWADVPLSNPTTGETLVADGQNNPVTSWPQSFSGTQTPAFTWDAATALASLTGPVELQVRAIFTDQSGNTLYMTQPMRATLDQTAGGTHDATAPIGPGTVDLLTGNFTTAADDVSIDAFNSDLTASRTYNSRQPDANPNGPLGPGWTSSLPVDAANSAYVSLKATFDDENGDLVTITSSDGTQFSFDGYDGEYWPEPGSEDLWLERVSNGFTLTDLDGNTTTFEHADQAADPNDAGTPYVPKQIEQPGDSNKTTLRWDNVQGVGWRITRIYAPTPQGVSCPDNGPDITCRFLSLTWAGATTALGTSDSPSDWGDFAGNLAQIDFKAHDPSTGGFTTTPEVRYSYDHSGRLREADDMRPTVDQKPALKTTYSYGAGDRLTKITPPGEDPWTLTYQSAAVGGDPSRLSSVSRPALPSGTATTTVVYGVPLDGTSSTLPMRPSDVGLWGQSDFPTDATAVFPPDRPPDNPTRPNNYAGATINYVDAKGRTVNVLQRNSKVTTTEWDGHDNVRRELTAANWWTAAISSNRLATSRDLDTQYSYSPDGKELWSTLGPLHMVQLADGSAAQAREHTTTTYDEDLPGGEAPMHLPSTTTVGAQLDPQTTQTSDVDTRVTHYSYTGQSNRGLTLRKPTSVIVDPGAPKNLGLTSTTQYAANGLVTQTRTPAANATGTDAHTTNTYYWNAQGAPSDCAGHPEWTNLPCKTEPGGQPSTGTGLPPSLPVTKSYYDRRYQVTQQTETVQSTNATRTTNTVYDNLTRPTSQDVTASEGTSIPAVTYGYDDQTGRLLTTQTTEAGTTRTIRRHYDSLGRIYQYDDADGGVATTTYDIAARPLVTTDKNGAQVLGSQTRTYDSITGLLTNLDDSAITGTPNSGTQDFTADEYNSDGQLTKETYPNGLQAQTTYDATGALGELRYQKIRGACSGCTWLDFTAVRSIQDQIVKQDGSLSNRSYAYDAAGRLTQAKDTPANEPCVMRTYSYDDDSNRKIMQAGAACDGNGGSQSTYSYDSADRLTNSGVTYDSFGNITALPGSFAGGANLGSSYYANDLVRTQTQHDAQTNSEVSNTYELDPALRQRKRVTTTNSIQSGVEVYHYADNSDSPAWMATADDASSWMRNIEGIGGDLAAIRQPDGSVKLEITNLHGDIVATASTDQSAASLENTFKEADEFGVLAPGQQSSPEYGWLGGKERRTELSSGVIQMGVRSYVPQLGRFLQTDPVPGGSANAYDYAAQDPVNSVDLNGERRHQHLTRSQKHVAAVIFHIARHNAGLSRAHAREMVAAAWQESGGLNRHARNPMSGAVGLFQLLDSDLIARAKRLGGVFNVGANTRAILPRYVAYWKQHPNARPGEAAAYGAEKSGEPPSWYAEPLQFLPKSFPCHWNDCGG
jgi:RHS repeat-associated protein